MLDVLVILFGFIALARLIERSTLGEWQKGLFGFSPISETFLFFVMPLAWLLVRRVKPSSIGLTSEGIGQQLRIGIQAAAFVAPATVIFVVLEPLGTNPYEWFGAFLLAFGFILAGFVYGWKSSRVSLGDPNLDPKIGLSRYAGLLLAGLLITFLLHQISPLASRLVAVFIFVGFLEEFFFRGVVQSRLNDCFGKPIKLHNVPVGLGLPFSAVIFGLFHPLLSQESGLMPWALWTGAMGLVLGFLREKSGSIVAPTLLHGLLWVPGVLFGPTSA